MKVLRTLDDRFVGLPDFGFEPNYVEIDSMKKSAHWQLRPIWPNVTPPLLRYGTPFKKTASF